MSPEENDVEQTAAESQETETAELGEQPEAAGETEASDGGDNDGPAEA